MSNGTDAPYTLRLRLSTAGHATLTRLEHNGCREIRHLRALISDSGTGCKIIQSMLNIKMTNEGYQENK
jgi:hypothetical protein